MCIIMLAVPFRVDILSPFKAGDDLSNTVYMLDSHGSLLHRRVLRRSTKQIRHKFLQHRTERPS